MENKMSGIYKIENLINGKIYIGSSINMESRFKSHFGALRGNRHHNIYLQRSFNKHGEDNFDFEVIEQCDKGIMLEREQYYIDLFDCANRLIGYNICENSNRPQPPKKKTLIFDSCEFLTVECRNILCNLKDGELSLLLKLSMFLTEPMNQVKSNGKDIRNKDIMNICNIKKSSMYSILKHLEDMDIIKRNREYGLIINPKYAINRNSNISNDCKELFNK